MMIMMYDKIYANIASNAFTTTVKTVLLAPYICANLNFIIFQSMKSAGISFPGVVYI